jgi:hypothetical protein
LKREPHAHLGAIEVLKMAKLSHLKEGCLRSFWKIIDDKPEIIIFSKTYG